MQISSNNVVFCDFDGTITVEETFVAVFQRFAPEISAQLLPKMYSRELPLRQGVRQILESLPASTYQEIIKFSKGKEIRHGLVELLDFLEAKQVPFVVVSGGLKGIVEVVLGELKPRVAAIYAVDVDTSGENLRLISEYEGEIELVDKKKVMSRYTIEGAIAIGDSLTDLNMALAAPLVFARDRLSKYLEEQQKPYIPWQDFLEIRDYLGKIWA